jgi:putative component of membrane protein insertase Oxa1/YidC/SpoIIIJ protein YidD
VSIAVGLNSFTARAAIRAIRIYQRHISPRKGFVCAHRVLHRGDSCSEHGRKLIESHGLIRGIRLLGNRFQECRQAKITLVAQAAAARVIDDEIDGPSPSEANAQHPKSAKRNAADCIPDGNACGVPPGDCGCFDLSHACGAVAGDTCIGLGCDAAAGADCAGCEAIAACA